MTDFRALVAQAGGNDLDYAAPGLPDRKIVLRSARPRNWTPQTPLLFVHHGVERNGADYRNYWLPLVDSANLLVIVPEFPKASFPGSAWYNYGNRTGAHGEPNPMAQWTYVVDQTLFPALQQAGLVAGKDYGVWGHSAGAQYVHRMVSLGMRDHLRIAISANAGSYAMPDLETPFPYGLGGTGLTPAALASLLQFPLTIMTGTADTKTDSAAFPKEAGAMAQGANRHLRAQAYHAAALAQSKSLGVACAWRITDVPNIGHDGKRMAAAAAPTLSAALHAS